MACYSPFVMVQRENGRLGFHDRPGDVGALRIPCGVCVGCRLDRASSWAVRCVHEASMWSANSFSTLTYDDANVPVVVNEKTGEEQLTLCYRDVQLFLKRLRARVKGVDAADDGARPIRFFVAGEYGSHTDRPHYHLLLFNYDFADKKRVGKNLFESTVLSDLWPHGHASTGSLTPASAAYTAQYSLKKVSGRYEAEEHYGARAREFVHMSRRGGIGRVFVDKYMRDMLPRDFVVIDGKKKRVPRYYLNLLKECNKEVFDEVIENREVKSALTPVEERSFERLAVGGTVCKARLTMFDRRGL